MSTPYLGVVIGECLVENSLSNVLVKISKFIFIFYKVRKLMLYNSLVYPHLTYCNSVWCSGPKTTIGKLLIDQKEIVRAIIFIKSKDHSAPLMKSCNMLNIFNINKYIVSTFVYECVKGRISETGASPIETFTLNIVVWVIL